MSPSNALYVSLTLVKTGKPCTRVYHRLKFRGSSETGCGTYTLQHEDKFYTRRPRVKGMRCCGRPGCTQ